MLLGVPAVKGKYMLWAGHSGAQTLGPRTPKNAVGPLKKKITGGPLDPWNSGNLYDNVKVEPPKSDMDSKKKLLVKGPGPLNKIA